MFADPTQEEEDLVNGDLTIVTKNSEEICVIHKPSMLTCLRLAGSLYSLIPSSYILHGLVLYWLAHRIRRS